MIPDPESVRVGQIWQSIDRPDYQITIKEILVGNEWNFSFTRSSGGSGQLESFTIL